MAVADFFRERLAAGFKETPTSCQERLFRSLSNFVVSYDEGDILIVSGYAGTGKTSAIGAFVKTLKSFEYKYVLLAPTGRAAKVLSGFTGEKALTIHKHIYRQKSLKEGVGLFDLNINRSKNTFLDRKSVV